MTANEIMGFMGLIAFILFFISDDLEKYNRNKKDDDW